jgi:hypothetical protein
MQMYVAEFSTYMLQNIAPHANCISEQDDNEACSVPQVSALLN